MVSKNKNRSQLSYVIIVCEVVAVIAVVLVGRELKRQSIAQSTDAIETVMYSKDCNPIVTLKSGREESLEFKEYINKSCSDSPEPEVSADGLYAAFELRLVAQDPLLPGMKDGASYNNTYVYLASEEQWIIAHSYGAAVATGLEFTPEGDIQIQLAYDENPASTVTIKSEEYTQILQAEQDEAIDKVAELSKVEKWLGEFDQDGTSSKTGGTPKLVIDHYSDDEIVIHAYEVVPGDGHTATLDWFRFNRITKTITSEFDEL